MSVKCILQGQNDKSLKFYLNKALPAKPTAPIAADEEIPYSWEELNAIALSGKAAYYVRIGAIKSVTLTSAVLGTTTHDVRIIGINQDNDQSITFQAKNCLANPTAFSPSSAQWIGSTARTECQNYYNAFPGKAAIKTVKKGTCLNTSTDSSRNGDVTYNDETVWLPSEREMGLNSYAPLSTANSSIGKAECTQGKNFAYHYYTTKNSRLKYANDSSSSLQRYWERSRDYKNTLFVCGVDGGMATADSLYSDSIGFAPAFVIGNEENISKDTLIQDNEDVTSQVKSALNAADATIVNTHIANASIHVTAEEKEKLAKAVTTSGVVYNSALPAKPSTPITDGEEIPYSWEEINAITLAGKAQEYFSLGATKLVNLSTTVLGANAATMMVIGFNQDGENTTTFQTKGALSIGTAFDNSAVWIGSTFRAQCQNFYNACEAKNFIKIVSKGTCPDQVSSKDGTATYNDETVWIPSETEMGLDNYSSLTKSNSTTSNSECTQGYNAGYSYYTSNTTRVKYWMNANGMLTTSTTRYWERSRNYGFTTYGCYVDNDGKPSDGYYGNNYGFAPAFVIGNGEPSKGTLTQDGEDITDKVAALITENNDGYKVGDMLQSIRTNFDNKWLLCNGQVITSEEYPELFSLLLSSAEEQWENFYVVDASSANQISPTCMIYANGVFAFAINGSSKYAICYMNEADWGVWHTKSYGGNSTMYDSTFNWNDGMWTLGLGSYFYYGTDVSNMAQIYTPNYGSTYDGVHAIKYIPESNTLALGGNKATNSYSAFGKFDITAQTMTLHSNTAYNWLSNLILYKNYMVGITAEFSSPYRGAVLFADLTSSNFTPQKAFLCSEVSGYSTNDGQFFNTAKNKPETDNNFIAILSKTGNRLLYGNSLALNTANNWKIVDLPKCCSRIWYQDNKWYVAACIGITDVSSGTIPTSIEIYQFDSFENIITSNWGTPLYTFVPPTYSSNLNISIVPNGPVIQTVIQSSSNYSIGTVSWKQYKGIGKTLPNVSVPNGYQYIKAKES